MKKVVSFFIVIMSFLVLAIPAGAIRKHNPIFIKQIMSAQAVTAGSSSTSGAIDLSERDMVYGYFSVYVYVTGNGTAKVEYLVSLDGTNYLEPSSATDITTGFTKSSGPGSDGKDIFAFSPILAKDIKIKVTETGSSNPIAVTIYIAIW